ncbi:hypothetical protein HYT45_03150 [Candidatus Uhrbacteria bacterium]|nr:hypothetical protein [Candidatus Uhrbacteria bacterium]
MITKSAIKGLVAAAVLLGAYFTILTLISGWTFALGQFFIFWYFITGLALGFGIQIGLYAYLKNAVRNSNASGKMVAVTGTTSTAAMVSCCAHYLTNILPVIGATSVIGVIGQYQIELFWAGLAFNLAGIAYIANKIIKFHKL